ncbi:MAG: hypothetical protein ACLP1Y_08365 [Candidatus Acidiferrales bacterium]
MLLILEIAAGVFLGLLAYRYRDAALSIAALCAIIGGIVFLLRFDKTVNGWLGVGLWPTRFMLLGAAIILVLVVGLFQVVFQDRLKKLRARKKQAPS